MGHWRDWSEQALVEESVSSESSLHGQVGSAGEAREAGAGGTRREGEVRAFLSFET